MGCSSLDIALLDEVHGVMRTFLQQQILPM